MATQQDTNYSLSNQDFIGKTFGRLVVVSYAGKHGPAHFWLCRCSCGTEKAINVQSLRRGATLSCGCLGKEIRLVRHRTHGLTKTYFYSVWQSMRKRCYNPKAAHFADYGGRGITVCDRWQNSVSAFAEDMGPRPSAKHSLDRIDNDGNYEPSNCRWATYSQQRKNARDTTRYIFDGRAQCLTDWANELDISFGTLWNRLNVKHLSVAEAFTKSSLPTRGMVNGYSKLTDQQVVTSRQRWKDGETLTALAVEVGVSRETLWKAVVGRTWKHLPGAVANCYARNRGRGTGVKAKRGCHDGKRKW